VVKEVLEYGSLAGWPYWLAEGLRSIGVAATNVIPQDSDVAHLDRKLPHHAAIAKVSTPRLLRFLKRAAFLSTIPIRYSLVHYHGSHLLRGTMHHLLEGRYLSAMRVPMVVSFGGGDARIIEMARRANRYFYLEENPERDRATRKYLSSISRFVRFVATDCEMEEYVAPYFEKVYVFRQPIDLSRFPSPVSAVDRPPILLHVPTEPFVKGTEQILAAVEKLKTEGLQFEFRMVRNLTQVEFYKELSACDVYVDELRCGSYGVTAVEAMTCGKPTVTYIRQDLLLKYPSDLPLVNANPDTITDVLRELILDQHYRLDVGVRSRRYVERYHDSKVVARQMAAMYAEISALI